MSERSRAELFELQTFVVQLGAAMNSAGEPVYSVQERLTEVAHAYGAHAARISAFPTFMMVTMGRNQSAALELTTTLGAAPRLDQISALDRLVNRASRGAVAPEEGLRTLQEIADMRPRFNQPQSVAGYALLATGLCLILNPTWRDVVAAAAFGALVGFLRSVGRSQPALQVLMPILAAFFVSALSAFGVEHGFIGAGLRAMTASLIVFLPGAVLTTAVLELAAGQMVSGSSRLVAGAMQLILLAFGILAGVNAVGVPSSLVFAASGDLLGDWAPWLGVLVFAGGVMVAHSAPPRSFPGLLLVLYAAWVGQVIGNAVFGGYMSALVGAAVMTPVAYWVSRMPSAMPRYASFLPGFWLLVPGALGLIGLTEFAGDTSTGTQDIVATVVSIFAVAIGVLCGTLLLAWASVTGRIVGGLHGTLEHRRWFRRDRSAAEDQSPAPVETS